MVVAPTFHRFVRFALLLALTSTVSCSRERYRVQADREVEYLVTEKSSDPRWGLVGFNIGMDPRSRYYDPYPIDRTPMPQDDPASHVFMHEVDGMKGWSGWHRFGSRSFLVNPRWQEAMAEYVPINRAGAVELSLESALRLAYMNGPSYQQQVETLYLSALDVSTERFRLQTQFFGGNDTFYRHEGRLRRATGESNSLVTDTDLLLERRFATAGEMLVGFANSFAWQFAGPDTNVTSSLVNMNFVQPLLRGAGRDIALEQLTIVERALLGNLRAFQRYRKGMFTNVAIGDLGVQGPRRRGGFLGGTGLTGFSGTGNGGFGGVGAATGFGRGNFGGGGGAGAGSAGFAGGGEGSVGGFVGLLQSLQEIRNTQISLNSQNRTLALLESSLEAGIIDLTQVDQFRQNIETERAQLLQQRNGLEASVDGYLTGTLGLPPDLLVALDDTLIRQFQFLDDETIEVQNGLENLQDALGRHADDITPEIADAIVEQAFQRLSSVDGLVLNIQQDLELLRERLPQRLSGMEYDQQQALRREVQVLDKSLEDLTQRIARKMPVLQQISDELTEANLRVQMDQLVIWMRGLLTIVQELSLVQARARVESVVIDPLNMNGETAFQIAMSNRLDLMNARASLVDVWRLIQFNADALQSRMDVVFSGDVRTIGNNPLDFRGPTGNVRAGVVFDAPFTRLLERNNYRQALIDYQQDRRSLIQAFDNVHRSLRQLVRSMEQSRTNLEIQRRAVVIAIRRVDLTREDLNEPTASPEPGEPTSQLGPTAALNLLTALSDLRNTQNNFMSVWLNYYANELRIYRDTGLMQLDDEGNWIDIPIGETVDQAIIEEQLELPPPVPHEWIRDAFEQPLPPGNSSVPATSSSDFKVRPVSTFQETPVDSLPASHSPTVEMVNPPEPSPQ